ncbi:hypothetical protein GPALN_004244 [Globodera pallida]|nr:hypothetical protein GPALN_004244 [Globodera pallida]
MSSMISAAAARLRALLSSTTDTAGGAGAVAFNSALSYVAGSVGRRLGDLSTMGGAALIGWARVSGVLRSLAAELLDMPARPEHFGAVGDGVADDTTALQAAINTGRSVALRDGKVYGITAQLTAGTAGVRISGGATIKFLAAYPLTASGTLSALYVTAAGVTVEGVTFDGSAVMAAAEALAGAARLSFHEFLRTVAPRLTVRDCNFLSLPKNATNFQGAIRVSGGAEGCRIAGCYAKGNPGFLFTQSALTVVEGNVVEDPKDASIAVNGQNAYGCVVNGNVIRNGAGNVVASHIAAEEGAGQWVISNNVLHGYAGASIQCTNVNLMVDARGGKIVGNVINGGSGTTVNPVGMISVGYRYFDTEISSNIVFGCPTGNSNSRLLLVGASGCKVTDNLFDGASATGLGAIVAINQGAAGLTFSDNETRAAVGTRHYLLNAGDYNSVPVRFSEGRMYGGAEGINAELNAASITNLKLWLNGISDCTATSIVNAGTALGQRATFMNAGAWRWPHSITDRTDMYGSAAPTSGSWNVGDIVRNTGPAELGTAGNKYTPDGQLMNGATALTIGAAALLLVAAKSRDNLAEPGEGDELGGLAVGGVADAAETIFCRLTESEAEIDDMTAQANIAAFLAVLRRAEGTEGRGGYRACYGYRHTVIDMADHPALTGEWSGERLPDSMCQAAGFAPGCVSTAAGAYQIIRPTWRNLRAALGLPDFGPESQDAAAVELIRRRGALQDVRAGRFADAVRKCRNEWASLPGNYAGQGQRSMGTLAAWFTDAGGVGAVALAAFAVWYVAGKPGAAAAAVARTGQQQRDASLQGWIDSGQFQLTAPEYADGLGFGLGASSQVPNPYTKGGAYWGVPFLGTKLHERRGSRLVVVHGRVERGGVMQMDRTTVVLGVAGAAALAALYLARNGAAATGESLGYSAVNLGMDFGSGVLVGGVTAASEAVGLPTPAQTTTDPAVARWIIDTAGYFEASRWASAGALLSGAMLPAYSGTPPPAGSAVAQEFGTAPAVAPVAWRRSWQTRRAWCWACWPCWCRKGPAMHEKLLQAVVSGMAGAAIGWGAQALTLTGRVSAIEQGQARIETMVQALLRQELRAGVAP